jgi:hypothetical protein
MIYSSSLFTENLQHNEDYFPAHAWYDIAYGKYGRKASRIVKRFGKYRRKL